MLKKYLKFARKIFLPPIFVVKISLFLMVLHISRYYFNNLAEETKLKLNVIDNGTMLQNDTIDVLNAFILATTEAAPDEKFYMYNKPRSDEIGAFRLLPDSRDAVNFSTPSTFFVSCSQHWFRAPEEDLKVSIIIVFHNEARSMLVRTLASILARTSSRYLEEILLLDDCSRDDVDLLSQLNTFFQATQVSVKIRMHRNSQRLGVIASRNLAAKLAVGHYLVFLDSHCEVNVGWLEPLLDRVAASLDDNVAVSPSLDSIDVTTLDYHSVRENFKGGFDWSLHFHWVPLFVPMRRSKRAVLIISELPKSSVNAKPFRSPTFAGGIFMISRNWFFKLNGFNPLLEIWGGESIEMSIKMWLCGGQIEIVPCSRVGHVFRQQHPFDFPNGDDGRLTYLRNSKVIAESWLDDYKHLFYATRPAAKNISIAIPTLVTDRLKLNLSCRPFSWFLQNVFKELKLPNEEFIAYGQLSSNERCLQIRERQLSMTSCYENDVTEWHLDRKSGQLLVTSGVCLDVVETSQLQEEHRISNGNSNSWLGVSFIAVPHRNLLVVLQYCTKSGASQRWLRRNGRLIHAVTRLCLDNPLKDVVTVSRCRRVAPTQLFRFSMEMEH